jgi:hypothetical protein
MLPLACNSNPVRVAKRKIAAPGAITDPLYPNWCRRVRSPVAGRCKGRLLLTMTMLMITTMRTRRDALRTAMFANNASREKRPPIQQEQPQYQQHHCLVWDRHTHSRHWIALAAASVHTNAPTTRTAQCLQNWQRADPLAGDPQQTGAHLCTARRRKR